MLNISEKLGNPKFRTSLFLLKRGADILSEVETSLYESVELTVAQRAPDVDQAIHILLFHPLQGNQDFYPDTLEELAKEDGFADGTILSG